MKEKSRKVDLLARYDDEKFACLLPMTNTNEAFVVAERTREAIENVIYHWEGVVLILAVLPAAEVLLL